MGENTKCPKCKQMTIVDDSEGYEVCSDSDCGWFEEGLDARHDKDLKLKTASNDRAFRTGWAVVKGKLQCNGREHIQLIEKDGVLMTDCECEKGCLPTKMTRA